jgi:Na+-transporting methylmalonyl-CoA/oxaloacetate decarboxylase gamma subunit
MAAALIITAIGMTLLFLALAFFYGLMALMTAAVKDRPASRTPAVQQDETPGETALDVLLQVAAIAVSVARAEAEQEFELVGTVVQDEAAASGLLSPWWALHHQRQLALYSHRRRVS